MGKFGRGCWRGEERGWRIMIRKETIDRKCEEGWRRIGEKE